MIIAQARTRRIGNSPYRNAILALQTYPKPVCCAQQRARAKCPSSTSYGFSCSHFSIRFAAGLQNSSRATLRVGGAISDDRQRPSLRFVRFDMRWISSSPAALIILSGGLLLSTSAQGVEPRQSLNFGTWGFDVSGENAAIKPGDDFFEFAN